MRVFSASLATEINTFSPIPTDLASFKEGFLLPCPARTLQSRTSSVRRWWWRGVDPRPTALL